MAEEEKHEIDASTIRLLRPCGTNILAGSELICFRGIGEDPDDIKTFRLDTTKTVATKDTVCQKTYSAHSDMWSETYFLCQKCAKNFTDKYL